MFLTDLSLKSLPLCSVRTGFKTTFSGWKWALPPAHVQASLKNRNTERLEWMKHLCQWNINPMLGDGLSSLTLACESWMALDQIMTASLPFCLAYYLPSKSTVGIKCSKHQLFPLNRLSLRIHGRDLIPYRFSLLNHLTCNSEKGFSRVWDSWHKATKL